jgi:hypothetical protein
MYDPACLNQSNLPELMRHMHVLNPVVQTRLDAVEYRLKTMPERFDRQGQHYRESSPCPTSIKGIVSVIASLAISRAASGNSARIARGEEKWNCTRSFSHGSTSVVGTP